MRRTGWRSLLYVRSGGLFSFFFFFTDNSFDIAQKYLGKRKRQWVSLLYAQGCSRGKHGEPTALICIYNYTHMSHE